MRYLVSLVFVLALGVMGCSESGGAPPDPSPYSGKDLWLCRPDIENDRCDQADLTFTEIRPDGSKVTGDVVEDPNAEADCFYIHHTVYFADEAGNREILVPHPEEVIRAVFRNGAHYRGVCRVFAPMYHQMSLITYGVHLFEWQDTEFFERAYADVSDAFDYYLRHHNDGRGIVLVGHSQGSHVLTRLLQDRFENDQAQRDKLVSAVLMGPTGVAQVPEGELVGGTFGSIPLCASASQTGCVLTFDAAYPETDATTGFATNTVPPMSRACVNPATFDGSLGTLAALMYPRIYDSLIPFPDGIDTEWVRYPNIYTAQCSAKETEWCNSYACGGALEIQLADDYTGEVPSTPKELQDALVEVWETPRRLHSAEYFIANADLIPIVKQQIAAWKGK